ncbi:MAG: peptidase C1 [Ignavibacteriae bacterium]|nr:peptidase C1 [Ignavibacteriota bacterium]
MQNYRLLFLLVLIVISNSLFSQEKNKGVFTEPKSGFFDDISKEADRYASKPKADTKNFKVDFTGMDLPKNLSEFTYAWHNETVSQGLTGTCWSFSTTSYFESEVYRIHNRKIKISPLFTVYWEYVEKAKRFVSERGNSLFSEGSEANAVLRIWQEYGAVPEKDYTGLKQGQVFHDHRKMIEEMTAYLEGIKKSNNWNEEEVVSTVKSIMNFYMGAPPSKVNVDGDDMTPKEYFKNVIALNPDDYVEILSYMQQPYNQFVEYEVSDNWWHSREYYNIPLDEFMTILKDAVKKGYTVSIGGDVSEPGMDSWNKVAMIPTFDIPSQYIDESARQFRFSNQTTTDDHGIHLVGMTTKNGKDWYLIKDSGAGSKNVDPKGYYFYNDDFVKLKMMNFTVHKDALPQSIKSKLK